MSLMKQGLQGASRAFSRPSTLRIIRSHTLDPQSGAHVPNTETIEAEAHWTDFSEAMKRAGMNQHPRFAHMVDAGRPPQPDEILTIEGEAMLIKQVRRSSVGAVWYLGGELGPN